MNISSIINKRTSAALVPLALAGGMAAPVVASAATSHYGTAAAVTGDGSNGNPYTEACPTGRDANCRLSFPSRTLSGFLAHEYVPAYKCPANHPYLLNQGFAPAGTELPNGVEVTGLGPIGVSISPGSTVDDTRPGKQHWKLYTGTMTGFPNSSATNWTFGSASYGVILHCTSDINQASFSRPR